MSMLSSKSNTKPNTFPTAENTIIANSVTIKGDIQSSGVLRIDGEIQGNVTSNARIIIGKSGRITGNIQGESCEIEGITNGNIMVKGTLALKSTAKVEGEISTQKLIVDEGAIVNVSAIKMTSNVMLTAKE